MLLRAYRITDKIGIVILKLSAALVDATLEGLYIIRRAAVGLFVLILSILWMLLKPIRMIVSRLFPSISQAGTRAVSGVGGAASNSMARRAKRMQLDASMREDPLKAQNRALNALTIILLVALVGVLLWATNPARNPTQIALQPNNEFNASLFAANDTPEPTQGGANLLPTMIPTATALPQLLQVQGAIAYTAFEGGQSDIWAVPIDGRAPIRITNDAADERDPVWSPDGRRLAYAGRADDNWEIYIYEVATNTTTRLTFDLAFQGAPSWSPDGEYLVYESYQGNNLDIYIMRADGEPIDGQNAVARLPANSEAPDFAPSWSIADNGRRIAFVSWRDGNQDIYVFSLDDQSLINLTNTPTRHEDMPTWSPTGDFIAYSALDEGVEKVFVKSVANPNEPAQVIGRGRAPTWSPDGLSIVAVIDTLEGSQLVASPFGGAGVVTPILQVQAGATSPHWTSVSLPQSLVNGGGLPSPVTGALFIEQEQRLAIDPPYRLRAISVNVQQPSLNERVDDSFNAMRQFVLAQAGWDVLGRLDHAFWDITRPPSPGEAVRSWFKTGRAIGIPRADIVGNPPAFEVVREDIGVQTYWRVYVRVVGNAQSGQLGEPLRYMPWDFASRTEGDVQSYDQGGRLKATMPSGYYIDLTAIAETYGWQRQPAGSDWRANINSVNYWLFVNDGGLTWYDAMRELYTEGALTNFAPTSTPAPFIPDPIEPTIAPTTEPEATEAEGQG